MEREVGGGIGMGNTCKSMADSFQCMTKPTTMKKKIILESKKNKESTVTSQKIWGTMIRVKSVTGVSSDLVVLFCIYTLVSHL